MSDKKIIQHSPATGRTVKRRSTLSRRVNGALGSGLLRLLNKQQEHRRLQFAATGAAAKHIVFLGDSISEFGNWSEWFRGEDVLNRGIGGEVSAQVLARLDSAINDPRAVFLLIGTNDLSSGVPEATIESNVRMILAGIERRAPGTRVYVQSVMPRAAAFGGELLSLNERLERLTAQFGPHVEYLDLWPTLADAQGALKKEYTLDALHLNGLGYRAWSDVLRPLIAALP